MVQWVDYLKKINSASNSSLSNRHTIHSWRDQIIWKIKTLFHKFNYFRKKHGLTVICRLIFTVVMITFCVIYLDSCPTLWELRHVKVLLVSNFRSIWPFNWAMYTGLIILLHTWGIPISYIRDIRILTIYYLFTMKQQNTK